MRIGNNIPKQVYENTKDIQELQNAIKPEYNCSATLTSSSVSVAIASTNAPAGTDSGWLLTEDGLKFKITGGDDTNLLLEFYADLKGPQGEDGAALNIDDTGTSLTKVWSSSKTSNVISGLINDSITSNINTWSSDQQTKLLSSGIAWTTTDKDGDDQISLSNIYIGSRTAYESLSIIKVPMLKVSDLIVYVDGDLKAKTLYRVESIASNIATVAKVCDFAQGKTLYQHNVRIILGSNYYELFLQITNDNPNTMFTDLASIVQYLNDNNHTVLSGTSDMNTNFLKASGRVENDFSSTVIKQVEGIYHNKSLVNSIYAVGYNDSTSWQDIQVTKGINNLTIKEFIKAL